MAHDSVDVAVVGAGAAGLMAAIWAARTDPRRRIVCLDGAARPGAKILIAGGGRCNVTHDVVDEHAFAGSSRHAIKKVLRRFDVPETIAFFAELGVPLQREEGGKLFPTTNQARTVLDALLAAVARHGAAVRAAWRVETITPEGDGFRLEGPAGRLTAGAVVLATGGRSVPKTGSDGHGYTLATALGHTVTPTFPALVPLLLPRDHFLLPLHGIAADVRLELRTATGKRRLAHEGALLCTHSGVSGPVVLDVSRHWRAACDEDPGTRLLVHWLPQQTPEAVDAALLALGPASAGRWLHRWLPERLARALCTAAGVDPSAPGTAMTRERRRALVETVTAMPLPISGDRGFTHAEVTAGGVPLTEVQLATMASRVRPGLFLCGEILDVDGRIGGYNFQWAWASGYVAGVSVARAVSADRAASPA